MASWFKKYWRTLILIAASAVAGAAGQHTVASKIATGVVPVVNAIPCTPGEVGCEGK